MGLIPGAATTAMSKLLADRALLRNATVIQGASGMSFVLAYLFHVYMGRVLGPAEYGLLGALLAILNPISISLHTLQNTVAKLVATAQGQRRDDQVGYIMARSTIKVGILGVAVTALVALALPLASSLLSMSSPWPMVMLAASIAPTCLLSVGRGVLQGLLSFNWLAANGILEKSSELGMGVALVSLGWGVTGGMAAYTTGVLLALLTAVLPLRYWARQPRPSPPTLEVGLLGHGWPIFLAVVLVTLMSNIDLLLVRLLLSPVESGYYASVSMVGKVTFFSASAMAGVLFPTVTKLRAQEQSHAHVLGVGLAFIGVVGGGLFLISALFPARLIVLLFGGDYLAAAPLLSPYVLALALLSLSIILIYYHLAQERNRFLIFLGLATSGEAALLGAFHGSALEIIWSLVAVFSLLLVANILYLAGGRGKAALAHQPTTTNLGED